MREWWLYKKQPEPDTDVPVMAIIILYVATIAFCLLIRAFTWPEKEHVTAIFLVPSFFLPACLLSVFVFLGFMMRDADIHYAETRKFVAQEREINLKAHARQNMAIVAWSAITPLAEPALNMLKLEGEFPLAPKTPVKIQLEEMFDQTRNEQVFARLLAPMEEKLKGYHYRNIETFVWVRGSDDSCVEELRRSLERLGVEDTRIRKIEYSADCPDYELIGKLVSISNDYIVNRLIIIVDLHEEGCESKCMENASAFLLTNHYSRVEGEKPVYLYQPMSGVTDVEEKMPIYLEVGSVKTPKTLWYTGLSRTEKYPLMQALDQKGLAADRLDVDASLGEKSAGYRWLTLALAADAVKYAQGEQLVATSEKNKFGITALSSQRTTIPSNLTWGNWQNPVLPAFMAGLFFIFSILFYYITFSEGNSHPSIWTLLAYVIVPLIVFISIGVSILILKSNAAYRDMRC
ncbi:hypothetical protein [Lelliottia wanjuensis]|uniref:hypothetical protein n=1 Tax=Lelliottia wanjuensis TaxID=3050585 RepID=UPI00254B2CB5|nr:hypothetical protein [Lelliottia sp. V86_10]MDK9585619.1 hypothetical protein [Lelliottia sp. V86_10]